MNCYITAIPGDTIFAAGNALCTFRFLTNRKGHKVRIFMGTHSIGVLNISLKCDHDEN